jgi:hypothetical protein
MPTTSRRSGRSAAALLAIVAIAALAALAPAIGSADTPAPDYLYWTTHAQTKVYPDSAAPAVAVHATDASTSPINLAAAQAESEGRQIAIRTGATGLVDVWLQPSDLTMTDESGTPHTIGASNASVFKVGYVRITHPSYGYKRVGLEPDPLLPMVLANGERLGWKPNGVAPDLTLRGVPANTTQPFYVLFDVPEDAAPGTYAGSVTITCSDATGTAAPAVTVPVTLTVYPFSVAQRTLKTAFRFDQWRAAAFATSYGNFLGYNPDPGPGATRVPETTYYAGDQMLGWLRYMADHRISPQTLPTAWDWVAGDGTVSARHDVLTDLLGTGPATTFPGNRLGFTAIRMPEYTSLAYLKNPFSSASARASAARYYSSMKSELGDDFAKAYVYPIDEPKYREKAFIEKYASFVHSVAPGSKFLLTTDSVTQKGKLVRGVDIYVYRLHWFFQHASYIKAIRAAHKEVWVYTHRTERQNQTPNFLIDKSLSDPRAFGWFAFKTRATGLLYFSIDRWGKAVGSGKRDPYREPLSTQGTLRGRPLYSNGDGSLVYPGYYPAYGLVVEGAPPVGSLRMEALRDGLEDYEYIKLAAARYGTAAADAFVARLIGPVPKPSPGKLVFPKYALTPTPYEQVRASIAASLAP